MAPKLPPVNVPVTSRVSLTSPTPGSPMLRPTFLLAAALLVATPALAQQPRGRGMQLPDAWIPFDSLAQALTLTDAQRTALGPLHERVDSIVRRGAVVRTQMRDEMQRNPDREQAQRFLQRLQTMQQRVDRALLELRAALTEEQQTALDGLRRPLVVPPRPEGGRRPGN